MLIYVTFKFIVHFVVGQARGGRATRVGGLGTGGRGRMRRTGVGFFAVVTRRVHAPMSLVVKPLRGVVGSPISLPSAMHSSLGVVSHGDRHLLFLMGRLLSFQGIRRRKVGVGFTSRGVRRLLGTIYRHFRPFVTRRKTQLAMGCPRTSFATVMSDRTMAGLIDGLLAGTDGCAGSRIALAYVMRPRRRAFVVQIASGNVKVDGRRRGGVFRPFCRTVSGGPKANVNLDVIGDVMRSRGNYVRIRSRIGGKSSFVMALPVRRTRILPRSANASLLGGPTVPRKVLRRSLSNSPVGRGPAVLVISSGRRVLGFLSDDLTSGCDVLATRSNVRTLGGLGRGRIALVMDS